MLLSQRLGVESTGCRNPLHVRVDPQRRHIQTPSRKPAAETASARACTRCSPRACCTFLLGYKSRLHGITRAPSELLSVQYINALMQISEMDEDVQRLLSMHIGRMEGRWIASRLRVFVLPVHGRLSVCVSPVLPTRSVRPPPAESWFSRGKRSVVAAQASLHPPLFHFFTTHFLLPNGI